MYTVIFGNEFLSSVKKLESKLKKKINLQLKLLQQNPYHPQLHTKPLHGELKSFYSLRVGRDYRLIFKFLNEHKIILTKAEHRSKIYR